MIWKYDGKAVNINKGFRNSDGYMSPKNWYTAQDDKLKKAEGLVWEQIIKKRIIYLQQIAVNERKTIYVGNNKYKQ